MLQAQLEHADEILDGLVNVGQAFGNVLMNGGITISHVIEEHLEVVIVLAQERGDGAAKHFVIGLGHEGFRVGIFHPLASRKQRSLQV